MIEKSKDKHSFPQDDIAPKVKEKNPYGLSIAKAIWSYASEHDTHLFYNDRENYKRYRQYALGRQSEDDYKPFLNEEGDSTKNWLKGINFAIKNYATKRINIAVSKILSKDYDVVVDMIDPLSKNMMENVKKSMEIKMQHKAKIVAIEQTLGLNNFEGIPENDEELQIALETDFKMIEAAHLEKAIPYHLERNNHEEIRKQKAFDMTTLGVSAEYTGLDENLKPIMERVNPSDMLAPYNENPDFSTLPYLARIKYVSAAEFRKMAAGFISDSRISEIIDEFATKQNEIEYGDSDLRRYDDINKIALLHYNYKSTDTMVFLEKKDEFGNKTVFEKDVNYYSKPKELEKFNKKFKGDRKIHRVDMNAVYEGYWVIGSEKDVFRHVRRSYSLESNGVFNNTGMGFKVYAPNSWDGHVTSMMSQMIPTLDELQKYNLKVQQLVSRAFPKGVGIDLYALRKANLSWGGKNLSDQEKIEMYMKSGIFVFSSKDRYAPGSNYKPFYEVENGLANDVDKYLQLIAASLNELDEIIGINKVVAASNIREDAGKAVTEMQVGASEVALDYLYDADRKIFQDVVRDVGRLHILSYTHSKKNKAQYDAMFGFGAMSQNVIRFDVFDYAFNLTVRPTDEEWREIYMSAEKAYDKGIIAYSDTLYLKEFTSIKQARLWLMMKEKRAMQAAQESKNADVENNAKVQERSIMVKAQADQQTLMKKLEVESALEQERRVTITHQIQSDLKKQIELLKMTGDIDRREVMQEGKIKDRHILMEGQIDKQIAGIKGSNSERSSEKESVSK